MAVLAIIAAFLILLVYMVGGAYSPAGIIIIISIAIGYIIVRRAKRRRGSAARL